MPAPQVNGDVASHVQSAFLQVCMQSTSHLLALALAQLQSELASYLRLGINNPFYSTCSHFP